MTDRFIRTRALLPGLALAMAAGIAEPAGGQTDYYNTDAGRPIQIE